MDKKVILIILTVVTLVGIVFLPLIGEGSFMDILDAGGLEELFEASFGIALFAAVVLSAISLICALSGNFGGCQACSWLGVVAVALFVFFFGDEMHADFDRVLENLGAGTWVGFIGFIVCGCVAGSAPAVSANTTAAPTYNPNPTPNYNPNVAPAQPMTAAQAQAAAQAAAQVAAEAAAKAQAAAAVAADVAVKEAQAKAVAEAQAREAQAAAEAEAAAKAQAAPVEAAPVAAAPVEAAPVADEAPVVEAVTKKVCSCGQECEADSSFCTNCGAKL